MEKLISSRFNLQFVPESYILPSERRPRNVKVPLFDTIPVIDLGGEVVYNRSKVIQQIKKASQECGFFQKSLDDVMEVAKEFFELPIEDKASLYSEDPERSCRVYTSIDYANETVHYWRDNVRHACYPLQEHIQLWPEKPARYWDVVGELCRISEEAQFVAFGSNL
ncbi:hyoscyamine 6-dioxygenase-like [Quillaja saponaria]|uniref:Hyoscyamine 6-dioxygenase-like n=1 Tax=Quillaja saponaria TaxID=32244 RepID=A0AAD7Q0U6_QUISA|nr:hyoscyamine 6-dioxygenase-like [Quillaja saponaria]